MDDRGGNNDIYGCDISGQKKIEFPICTDANGQWYPKISGNVVVWQDDRNDDSDIYGCYLPSGTPFEICRHAGTQANPAIYGDMVVWEDNRNGNYDIYGYRLSTHAVFPVRLESGDQVSPAVDANIIVWQGNGDIYGAYIPEPSVIRILSPNGGEMLLAGANGVINWSSSGAVGDYVKIEYSTNNGQDYLIIDPNVANTSSFDWDPLPIIDSNQCKVRISNSVNPAVFDESDDVFTIFICDPNLTGDMVKDCVINMLDFAALAGQWLECGNRRDTNWCDNN